jgi:peptidoglycan/xylan/chitin deacetylase (PgdA/CDA1 family)
MTAYASTPAFKQEGFLAVAEDSTGEAHTGRGAVKRSVYLTFDAEHPDRPHHRPDGAEAVLDVLAATGVSATFFLQGRWASANPRVASRIAQDGHTIGSHSNTHVLMSRLSDHGLIAEVKESEERIRDATGADPRPYFRCPYGDGHDDPRVVAALSAMQYRLVGWDVDPRDWDQDLTVADLVSSVQDDLALPVPRSPVILLHTWPAWTAAAVTQIIESAEEELLWAPLERPPLSETG